MAKYILSNGSVLGLYGVKTQLNCFAGFGVRPAESKPQHGDHGGP